MANIETLAVVQLNLDWFFSYIYITSSEKCGKNIFQLKSRHYSMHGIINISKWNWCVLISVQCTKLYSIVTKSIYITTNIEHQKMSRPMCNNNSCTCINYRY